MRTAYVTILGLAALYCLSSLTGVIFSLSGFIQSDTCWLTKLGMIILKSRAIPGSDPFSFTLPLAAQNGFGQPFVVYQWLSELVFALAFKKFALNGLLVLCTAVTVLASVALLFRLCLQASGRATFSFFVVALTAASVALRLMVRPEIFTLLFLTIWLTLLLKLRNKSDSDQVDWQIVGLMTLTMVFWCNMHTGFVIGLILLALYTGLSVIRGFVNRSQTEKRWGNNTLATALLCCLAATFLNPAGLGLWTYLPRLFFAPMNMSISETQGMSLRELLMPLYYPYFLLIITSVHAIYRSKTSTPNKDLKTSGQDNAQSIIVVLLAITASVFCKRLASPMALILAFEASSLSLLATSQPAIAFFRKKISILALEIPVLALATSGVLLSSDRLVPLTMPQANERFRPSFPAIEFMLDHWHGGRIFNDAQIGSMLTMYGPAEMKVFIDTRLDAYGDKILKDYCDIIDVREHARELLDSYNIDWVIVTQGDRLNFVLTKAPNWTKEFEDSDAVIFKRTKLK